MSTEYAENLMEKITGIKKVNTELDEVYYTPILCNECNKFMGSFYIANTEYLPFVNKVSSEIICAKCTRDVFKDRDD